MEIREAVPVSYAAKFLQCSTRNIYNLFNRDRPPRLEGYLKGAVRGLMIYKDSLEKFKNREPEPG